MRSHLFRSSLGFALCAAGLCASAAEPGLPRLTVRGAQLLDPKGQPVVLKGCNLGSWLLIEPWMLGIHDPQIRDQYGLISLLESRFGAERAAQLMELYRENWITPRELEQARAFGCNVVRLPFHCGLLFDETQPRALRTDAFAWLDRAVTLAEQAGLYVILDLHGAPGGQNVEATTGRAGVNALWTEPAHQEATAWLWQQIAAHCRDRDAVVAYDVLNEPWSDFKTDIRTPLLEIVGRVYTAIRTVDPDKLVFLPGSLQGISFYGDPRARGWINVGFTEHFYPGLFGQGAAALETHARFLSYAVAARRELLAQWNAPYLIGEFNVVFDRVARPEIMRRYFDEFGRQGWLATMWSLRLISPEGGVRPDNWYLVTNAEPFKLPDLRTASYDDVAQALRRLGTLTLVADEPLRAALTAPTAPALPLADFDRLANAAPAADAIPGWSAAEVAASPAGSVQRSDDGAVTVYGGGSDLWNRHDEFHYIYRPAQGDFAAQNCLTALTTPHPFAKAGWMLRASLAPDAAHVLVHAFADGRVMLAWRAADGALMREQTLAISGLPVGLGLERQAGVIQVRYTDADGQWHREALPEEVKLPDNALLGLIVMSHDNTTLASATFDSLDVKDTPPTRATGECNLLQNASFEVAEDAAHAADRAQHWGRWGQWINRESDWQPRRDGACLLAYHHWQIDTADNSGVYQDVAGLKAGTRCTFSVYANRDAAKPEQHGPQSVEVRIESRYGDRLLTVASQTYAGEDIATNAGWSLLQVTGTLPADNARVLVVVNPSPQPPRDAALKFDLAALHVVPGADHSVTASISNPVRFPTEERKEETHE